MTDLIAALRHGLIVSCQPVPGGPFDDPDSVVRFALAARDAGAKALRIEGVANVAAVVRACDLPVIGLTKRDLDTSPVRITPFREDVAALAEAGAAIIAFDATDRVRPEPVASLLTAVRAAGRLAMADIATLAEARTAKALDFDLIGTTLSGYTEGVPPGGPDLELVHAAASLGPPLIAEGRYNAPALAAAALRAGAYAVVVGSAITRPEHITAWFAAALREAADDRPVLALDIGGSKIAVALVSGGRILDRRQVATDPHAGAESWLEAALAAACAWPAQACAVAAAVSGSVHDGTWSAINPAVLPVPANFPLVARLAALFGLPAFAFNDAQAAAWGEHRFGAGEGRDLLFLTISSGIGGGIVSGGRLVTGAQGLAGHVGQCLVPSPDGALVRLEDRASGFAIARRAAELGHTADAPQIFLLAMSRIGWAEAVIRDAIAPLGALLPSLQAILDPDIMVIGGGVGLGQGYADRLTGLLANVPPPFRPTIVPARLGANAGLLGVADLAV